MFYSTEILSFRNKTALALLFYISTTNNITKKINKKDIESVNIISTLTTLKHPPQPFALKLYAILIKGLVRVYSLKMKYYETEINSFYKNLTVKKCNPRKVKKRKVLKVNKFDIKNVDMCDDFFMDVIDTFGLSDDYFSNNVIEEDILISEAFSNQNNDFNLFDNDIPYLESIDDNSGKSVKRFKKIIDAKTVIKNDKLSLKMKDGTLNLVLNEKNDEIFCFKEWMKGVNILNDITNVLKASKQDKVDDKFDESVEKERKELSLDYIPQTSTSGLKDENQDMGDFNMFVNNDSSILDDFDILEEAENNDFVLNDMIKRFGKRKKAEIFLNLLENLSNAKIIAKQDFETSNIIVSKLKN